MPVEKIPHADIRRHGLTFTTVINEVALKLSAETLGVYVYLLSKPDAWVIRITDIQRQFGLGDHKWRKVSKELRTAGLLFDEVARDETGKVSGRQMRVTSLPEGLVNLGVDNQQCGEQTHLVTTDSLVTKDNYKGLDISGVKDSRREAIKEFITHRKNLKKPLTQEALRRFHNRVDECVSAGYEENRVIQLVIDKGWSGVEVDWVSKALPKAPSAEAML